MSADAFEVTQSGIDVASEVSKRMEVSVQHNEEASHTRSSKRKSLKYLSKPELIALVNSYQDCQRPRERERLASRVIRELRDLVAGVAKKFRMRTGSWHASAAELEQAGNIGIMNALRVWNRETAAEKKTSFTTYATYWIEHEVRRLLQKEYRGTVDVPINSGPKKTTDESEPALPNYYIPWHKQLEGQDDVREISAGDWYCYFQGQFATQDVDKTSLLNIVNKVCNETFNEQERHILRRRWLEEATFKAIGDELGVSKQAIELRAERIIRRLRRSLQAIGLAGIAI